MSESRKIKCLVVDDEPYALRLMQDEIRKISFLECAGACSSAKAAMPFIEDGIDLLFLDIQMPNLTGIQFLRTLKNPPMVIITTAYEKYALDGFELDVIDYLMKPIIFDRFVKAVNKARELFLLRIAKPSNAGQSFVINANYKKVKIFCDDVLYVEGLKDYVKIFLASSSKAILTRINLKGIESILPQGSFFRIHNSFIVNLSKITSFQKHQIFIDKKSLPVGEKFASAFEKRYGGSN
ncbi:MAG: response regulator transcription factor [Bacteroidetes bacterium]|nr:response regulator transcription factor [Bacteroidota bacterium]